MPAIPAGARGLIIESQGGPGDIASTRLIATAMHSFEAAHFAGGQTLIGLIETSLSRPGDDLNAAVLTTALQSIDSGYAKFLRGDFQDARTELQAALATLHSRPGTVARQQPLRDKVIKALMGLALASQRLDDPAGAEAAMAEFLRSFPDREISRATYGPEAIELSKRVKSKLDAAGKGILVVTTDDPTAVVFVNERYAGVGETTLDGLYPGEYRVYTQRAKQEGRVRLVTIATAQEQRLSVQTRLDGVLKTGPDWTGLAFHSVQTRDAEEVGRAAELGRALGEKQVVLIGLTERSGQRSLMATLVDADLRRVVRRATIATGFPAALEQLVAFVVDGHVGPKIEVMTGSAQARPPGPTKAPPHVTSSPARRGRVLRIAGLVTAGVGVLTLAGGVYFGLHAGTLEDEVSSAKVWSSALASKLDDGESAARNANILIGVGAACVMGGGVMWYLGHRAGRRSERKVAVQGALTPTSAGLIVTGSFR